MKKPGPPVSRDRMIHIDLDRHRGAYGRSNPRYHAADSQAVQPAGRSRADVGPGRRGSQGFGEGANGMPLLLLKSFRQGFAYMAGTAVASRLFEHLFQGEE